MGIYQTAYRGSARCATLSLILCVHHVCGSGKEAKVDFLVRVRANVVVYLHLKSFVSSQMFFESVYGNPCSVTTIRASFEVELSRANLVYSVIKDN